MLVLTFSYGDVAIRNKQRIIEVMMNEMTKDVFIFLTGKTCRNIVFLV